MAPPRKHTELGNPILNLKRNVQALREFITLLQPILENEIKELGKASGRDLIPLFFGVSAADPDDKANQISDEEKARLRARFGAEFEVTPMEDGGVRLSVPGEASRRFDKALQEAARKLSHRDLLFKNGLISLVSSAEWFLSQVLREFFEAFPDACGIKDKTLTLEDLRRLGSIEDAESYLISLRVDEIMWGRLEEWLQYLRNTVKLSMGYLTEDEAKLVEVFQRRNSMVHNNGIVHHSYLAKVKESLREGIQQGDPIGVTPEYLTSSIDIVEKCFVLIGSELWKKLDPKDERRASVLNEVTMDALFAERYEVAAGASRFLMEDRQLPEKWQLYGRLNYWQTQKWCGKYEEVRTEIEAADFSAKEDLVRLARHVLLDQFNEAMPLLEAVLKGQKLGIKDLEEWPIFKTFRNDERVQSLIETESAKKSATVQLTQGDIDAADSTESLAATAAAKQTIH